MKAASGEDRGIPQSNSGRFSVPYHHIKSNVSIRKAQVHGHLKQIGEGKGDTHLAEIDIHVAHLSGDFRPRLAVLRHVGTGEVTSIERERVA